MNIRKYLVTSVLSAALLLALGIPALAESDHAGSIKIVHDVVVHGKTLPAGKYLVHWTTHSPEATVDVHAAPRRGSRYRGNLCGPR